MSEFEGKTIKCRAAVCWAVGEDLKIEEIEVAPPGENEVRIKVAASGVCFSDIGTVTGKLSGNFPLIPGHEGAGVIESVGKGVDHLKAGDHVILSFMPQCKNCPGCSKNRGNFCNLLLAQTIGLMLDGKSRFSCRGQDLHIFIGTSTFSEYTVVNVSNCAKVDSSAPLEEVCLLACGVPTGYGGAINTGNVQQGSTCAVFGLGTIGLAAVMGCRDAKASRIIAIDINSDKFSLAKELGATDCINPKEIDIPIDAYLMQNFGGVENTIECIGSIATMKQALNSTTVGNGTCVLLGVSPVGAELPIDPLSLQLGKTVKGSFYGEYRFRDDISKLVDDYKNLSLEKFITHRMPLDKINEAFELLKAGKCIRTVITFE